MSQKTNSKFRNMLRLGSSKAAGPRPLEQELLKLLSPFFDERHYHSQVQAKDMRERTPLEHYLLVGFKKSKNPNTWLDGKYYLKANKDVAASGMSPLEHFIRYGFYEQRAPSRNSSCNEIPPGALSRLRAMGASSDARLPRDVHYKLCAELARESGLLDLEWMLQQYPDLKSADVALHYCVHGYKEGRNPNEYFNTKWYASRYKLEGENPLIHYITKGWRQGLNPSFRFDARKYIDTYLPGQPDVEPLRYHLEEGASKGHQPIRFDYGNKDCHLIAESGLMDFEWMSLKYPDLKETDHLLHYCTFGHEEGRYPNPFFDSSWYRHKYLDGSKENPLIHYIEKGRFDGHDTAPGFDSKKYFEAYPEAKRSGKDALSYYLSEGRRNGHHVFPCSEKSQFPVRAGASVAKAVASDILSLFEWPERELKPQSAAFDPARLKIHFVIPDFGVGGGGHMNIFRLVRWLEFFGHELVLWIMNPSAHQSDEEAYYDILRHYFTVKASVRLLDEAFDDADGDVIFATSWDTTWPVQSAFRFKRRFYLVQDYEPYFYAKGSRSELAELTYSRDVDCICASEWLDGLMSKRHGRWSRHFNLAADPEIFYPAERPRHDIYRIVLYARRFTERRAVELALVALEMLAAEGVRFHVDMFGVDFAVSEAPYSCTLHATRTPQELAELYRGADLGIALSVTNYSLVPQEMMACGLPILEFDGESARSIFPEGVVKFAGPLPTDMKDKIKGLLLDRERRERQSQMALQWVNQFSWEGAARKVEQHLIERLEELGFKAAGPANADGLSAPKASVIIPTCNGGELFKTVLRKVLHQRTPWPFEVIVLDSESDDGTVDVIKSHEQVVYRTIKRSEFNHGGTRNYGAELARGEFVAFLTQDALPANEFWLYDLVAMLERFPAAAGVFGKHIAHDGAGFYTRKELEAHFAGFDAMPLAVSKETPVPDRVTPEQWAGKLRFYSDNNSCLRKSVWRRVPYPIVQYGEDQIWGDRIIQEGYQKLYSPTAVVKHSHDYGPDDVYERAKVDADYFKHHWGIEMIDESRVEQIIRSFNDHATLIGLENGLSYQEIEDRKAVIRSRFTGFVAGQKKAVSLFSEGSDEKSKF